MTLTFTRTGVSAFVWRKPDPSWRLWAYNAGTDLGVTDLTGVTLAFQPTGKDARSIQFASNYWPTVEFIIDGLVGAGVIRDRTPRHIAEIRLRPGIISGADGMRVTVDGPEPPTTSPLPR